MHPRAREHHLARVGIHEDRQEFRRRTFGRGQLGRRKGLVVSKASAFGCQPVRTCKAADSPTWAHPVLVRGGVLIKDATMLTLRGWEWPVRVARGIARAA